mmetsp:Transcript_6585/g.28053  ORF Transcript_6585/g.28053 Transcript_6585/m.28053 type:complete len:319 (+) Transcript_6585:635-1591(+)
METSSCVRPALRQESTARSLYLLAHTPVMADHALAAAPWPPRDSGPSRPSGQGRRSAAKASCISRVSSSVGTTSWIAARMRASRSSNAAVFPKSIDASSARARSSSRRMGALSGDSSTTSNVQNGSAADAGRLIHSGRRPRSSCRFRDLLPTISPVNSGEATACLPMNRRRLMTTPPAGALIAPPSDEPPPPPPGAAPRLAAPPAMGSTRKSSAEDEGTHLTACPASRSISASFPASNTVAKRHPSLRARTETCDRMSGMSGVMTPTTPCGISSSPPTRLETRMVGTAYVLVWISFRSSTTSTTPEASTGEMMFQAPM